MKRASLFFSISLFALGTAAQAAETQKYTYDAKGRLVKVERSGSVNNDVDTDYEHDKVDNRKKKKVTVPQNPPPS